MFTAQALHHSPELSPSDCATRGRRQVFRLEETAFPEAQTSFTSPAANSKPRYNVANGGGNVIVVREAQERYQHSLDQLSILSLSQRTLEEASQLTTDDHLRMQDRACRGVCQLIRQAEFPLETFETPPPPDIQTPHELSGDIMFSNGVVLSPSAADKALAKIQYFAQMQGVNPPGTDDYERDMAAFYKEVKDNPDLARTLSRFILDPLGE